MSHIPTHKMPIDPEILQMKIEIPKLLAELSYRDQQEAIRLMREWGEKKRTINSMYEELNQIVNGVKAG